MIQPESKEPQPSQTLPKVPRVSSTLVFPQEYKDAYDKMTFESVDYLTDIRLVSTLLEKTKPLGLEYSIFEKTVSISDTEEAYTLSPLHSMIRSFEVVKLPREVVDSVTLYSVIAVPKDPKTYEEYMAGVETEDKQWYYDESKIQKFKVKLVSFANPIGSIKFFDYPIPMFLLPFTNFLLVVKYEKKTSLPHYLKLNCRDHPDIYKMSINFYTKGDFKPFFINNTFWDYFNKLTFETLEHAETLGDIITASITDRPANIAFTKVETLSRNNRLKLSTQYDFIDYVEPIVYPGEKVSSVSLYYRKDDKYIKITTLDRGGGGRFFLYPLAMFIFKSMGLSIEVEFENQRSDSHYIKVNGYLILPEHKNKLKKIASYIEQK